MGVEPRLVHKALALILTFQTNPPRLLSQGFSPPAHLMKILITPYISAAFQPMPTWEISLPVLILPSLTTPFPSGSTIVAQFLLQVTLVQSIPSMKMVYPKRPLPSPMQILPISPPILHRLHLM